ncbi:MAG: HD-GYP domain-containing protein [Spirochaetia bacterium]|nr:HD-GYP domain-containing protein [Spirochaetia bacterium]
MNFGTKQRVLLLSGILLVLLAMNVTAIDPRLTFLMAGLAIAASAAAGGWINGIFMGLLFTFTYYSLHARQGPAELAVNTTVYLAIALLADRLKGVQKNKKAGTEDPEEKVFMNKVTTSFMLAHDVLWEIKKGVTYEELRGLFGKNISNLIGASKVLVYSSTGGRDTDIFELKYSYGTTESDTPAPVFGIKDIEKAFSRSVPAFELPLLPGNREGYATAIPIKNEDGIKNITVLYKPLELSHSDIYIAEFFTAQIFVIMEKQELLRKMTDNYEKIAEVLALAIDTKDHDTNGHSLEAMKYAVRIAEKLNLPQEDRQMIKYASLLHDIGKLKIDGSILTKKSALTAEEFATIKTHPAGGVDILGKIDMFAEILPIILYHHEHFDGKGYPGQLQGEQIPLAARICSVADAYSVMLSDRPYRNARTKEEAVEELKRCAGTQFDSKIVDIFLGILDSEKDDSRPQTAAVTAKAAKGCPGE